MIYRLVVKYRNFFVMLLHSLLISLAYLGSFYIRFDLKIPPEYFSLMLKTLPVLAIIKLIVFYYFGLFRMSIRFASVFDLWHIVKANVVATVCFIIAMVFVSGPLPVPRSIFIIDWVLAVIFIGGIRFISRIFRERNPFSITQSGRKTLVVGAGEAGLMILKEYRNNPNANVDVVGFIDDDRIKKNLVIHGVKVLGSRDHIPEIVKKYQIEEIIIAIPSASGEVIREIISYCQIPDVKIKIVPTLHKILSGDLEIKPREVRPEDLLG
ncbi:MAG: polysaccharide biosynthesis protein, partial [Candidatus Omnitrophota bacterium]